MLVKELLKDPANRTKLSFARDKFNISVSPNDFHAVKWCLLGACIKVGYEADGNCEWTAGVLYKVVKDLFPDRFYEDLAQFNDNTTDEEITMVLERAGV